MNEGTDKAAPPAEQGQEASIESTYPWLTVDNDGALRADLSGCVGVEQDRRLVIMQELQAGRVVPASELEMCQRYFDPMRRSRDEAEEREKELAAANDLARRLLARADEHEFKGTTAENGDAHALVRQARAALDQSGKP